MKMKKYLAVAGLAVACSLVVSGSTFARNFTGELNNNSTFETLQEAHESAPGVVQNIVENDSKTFVGHPALDDYPEGTTFVYRSANQYAGRAAARLNTNIIVYSDQHFDDKQAAMDYLENLGVTDLIDEATGSVVLATPIDPATGFGLADVKAYYKLQTSMLAQKDGGSDAEGNPVSYADAEYFGGYGYEYFIGIDGGATFFNNYLAPEVDFAGRLAGVFLSGGTMQEAREPSIFVPVYLLNEKEDVVEKYKEINGTDAVKKGNGRTEFFNQQWPLRRVITAENTSDLKTMISDAYYNMFVKAMRVPVRPQAVYSGGGEFSGYNFDEAPYSLCDRDVFINGRTKGGLNLIKHQGEDLFADIKTTQDVENFDGSVTPAGEYMDVWYEYLPDEVMNNTAPAGSVPLILALHGGGDDARVFVEEFGLAELADRENLALVAPDHQLIGEIRGPVMTALIHYMLDKYPALDASRVYATGFSMGGGASYQVGYYDPGLYAAIAPMSGSVTELPEDEKENFMSVQLPAYLSLSSFDGTRRMDALEGNINEGEQSMITLWAKNNGIVLPDFDFEKYPHVGLGGDASLVEKVNDEFERKVIYLNNSDGEPRVAFNYVYGMIHALYPEYSDMLWDFLKHYSRDLETGDVIYAP